MRDGAKASPSYRNSVPNLASQMRVAFSSMAWNTGSSSPGELLMTFSTSDGRGLLLQRLGQIVGALAQLVEQPRVLDGDDGLRGEVLHQLDLLVGERPHLLAIDGDGADQLVVLEHRHGENGAGAGELDERRPLVALEVGRLASDVGDVNDLLRLRRRGRGGVPGCG